MSHATETRSRRTSGGQRGSQAGENKWQYLKSHKTMLDTCPLECDRARPHQIAPGLMVCEACLILEHSDNP